MSQVSCYYSFAVDAKVVVMSGCYFEYVGPYVSKIISFFFIFVLEVRSMVQELEYYYYHYTTTTTTTTTNNNNNNTANTSTTSTTTTTNAASTRDVVVVPQPAWPNNPWTGFFHTANNDTRQQHNTLHEGPVGKPGTGHGLLQELGVVRPSSLRNNNKNNNNNNNTGTNSISSGSDGSNISVVVVVVVVVNIHFDNKHISIKRMSSNRGSNISLRFFFLFLLTLQQDRCAKEEYERTLFLS